MLVKRLWKRIRSTIKARAGFHRATKINTMLKQPSPAPYILSLSAILAMNSRTRYHVGLLLVYACALSGPVQATDLAATSADAPLRAAWEGTSNDMVLWYRQPAQKWLEAMPIGNGYMGAMVFGGLEQE